MNDCSNLPGCVGIVSNVTNFAKNWSGSCWPKTSFGVPVVVGPVDRYDDQRFAYKVYK
jgi:hypothetical protein